MGRTARMLGGLAALAFVAVVFGLGFAYPALAAVGCPTCFGFDRLADGVYVDDSANPDQRQQVRETSEAARSRVGAFYGRLASHPTMLICTTDACYRRIGGGGSRGMAILDWALFLSPRGANTTIASHELAHIELHHRIGLLKTWRRVVPQWFDEGLAVTISDDPRYLAPAGGGDRCLVASDGPLPAQRAAWIETAASRDLYAKAACRVSRWVARRGGSTAVVDLAKGIAVGETFPSLYQ